MLQVHPYCWKWQHFILFYGSVVFLCVCVCVWYHSFIHSSVYRLLLVFHWDSGTSSQFSSVQLLSRVWLFATPWTAVYQACLSITNSRSLFKLMSSESVMLSNHLILCRPLLPPSIFPSIRISFKWVSYSHQAIKVLEFQLQHPSFQ